MSYIFRKDRQYRMPTHFGPSLGPRQGPGGKTFAGPDYCKATIISAAFKANPSQLEAFLPPGFVLREPHFLKLEFCYATNIAWLAGRGYNTFGVSFPVTYQGKKDKINGELLLILWENKADPIITGREDLGFSKMYCEIPTPQFVDNKVICRASWDGFQFASLELDNLKDTSIESLPISTPSEGILHYKYIPKTSTPGEADAEYAVLTPTENSYTTIDSAIVAKSANSHFRPSTWEELPTLVHIVNALANLRLDACVEATILNGHGGSDLRNQRILS